MPKLIPNKTRAEIIKFAKNNSQPDTAKYFGVSRMFVNALVNNRPIKRSQVKKHKCPITGYAL